tara:strand:- start:56 stop:397 length:342 start_codon:yes stop_codon:yes gene_type:complete
MKKLLIKIDNKLGKIFGDLGIIDNIRYSIKPPKLIKIFNEELNRRSENTAYQIEQDLIWNSYHKNRINKNELKIALKELNTETMNRMLNNGNIMTDLLIAFRDYFKTLEDRKK